MFIPESVTGTTLAPNFVKPPVPLTFPVNPKLPVVVVSRVLIPDKVRAPPKVSGKPKLLSIVPLLRIKLLAIRTLFWALNLAPALTVTEPIPSAPSIFKPAVRVPEFTTVPPV